MVWETEKPNVSGWSAKRRLSMVDLPEPEGPDMTIGRWSWVAAGLNLSEILWWRRLRYCGGEHSPVGAIVACRRRVFGEAVR